MAKHRPLTANFGNSSVLLRDADAPRSALLDNAEHRLGAAKDLLFHLATVQIAGEKGGDVSSVANATYLLLEDASDLLMAAREAANRAGGGP